LIVSAVETQKSVRRRAGSGENSEQTTNQNSLVKMAARNCEISTESEDAEDLIEDSTAGKLLPSDILNGSSDSGSYRDNESEMEKVPFCKRRVEWETVETWDREVLEDCHILDCILNNAEQFMRGAGLSFVAGQKKKPTNLNCWTLRSKKQGQNLLRSKDKIYEVTI
jgi:hypothetical protein